MLNPQIIYKWNYFSFGFLLQLYFVVRKKKKKVVSRTPTLARASTRAPFLRRQRTTSTCPARAAMCSAVSPRCKKVKKFQCLKSPWRNWALHFCQLRQGAKKSACIHVPNLGSIWFAYFWTNIIYTVFYLIHLTGHIRSSAFYIQMHQLVLLYIVSLYNCTQNLSLSRECEAHKPQNGRGFFSRWSLPAHCVELAALKCLAAAAHNWASIWNV